MNRELFLQASVRVRNLEKKLLTKSQLERVCQAEDLEAALKSLKETSYGEAIAKLERVEDYDSIFADALNQMYRELLDWSPVKDVVNVKLMKFAFHNIKVALKEKILEEDFKDIYSPLYASLPELVKRHLEDERQIWDDYYQETAAKAYKLYQETGDPQKIEFYVDQRYFHKVLETVDAMDFPLVHDYFQAMIDFINLRTFIRCQKQGQSKEVLGAAWILGGSLPLEDVREYFHRDVQELADQYKNIGIGKALLDSVQAYKNTGRLLRLEKNMDNYLTKIMQTGKQITYGAEVLFAYVHAKEIEIKNLRIAFVAKSNGLSHEFIKERLRDTYV